jgi:hypothetical protein
VALCGHPSFKFAFFVRGAATERHPYSCALVALFTFFVAESVIPCAPLAALAIPAVRAFVKTGPRQEALNAISSCDNRQCGHVPGSRFP